ncbi:trans-acting enoyl reductase family protein [Hydrogenophaga sp.]|uniref:saccharopine dehydrogenase family protein n=1 Tax=Hydrogenophaga sp. TaxID=1904254 RepID=UPI00272F15EE|nr:hypothetical protein [Hydrogenophaga sp.]MDP2017546.1 hypothetical protein [Hydrogenophaga sp.]
MDKAFDIIVFGATGFTGRLVAEYLHNTYGANRGVAWAMAGRSQEKLTQVRDALGIGPALPLLVADANDAQALAQLVRVHGRVKVMKGGFSGGTAASLLATLETAGRDPALVRTLADPFALTPGFRGPKQPDDNTAAFDELAQSWTGPFVMAPINTKNVHRTHALRGHPWGVDFVYSERMLTGGGEGGEKRARALARNTRVQNALLAFAPTRALIRRFALPQPGQGPTKEQREKGRYEVLFIGQTADGRTLRASVKGDRDPGYGSTCKLITETALCLARETGQDMAPGGVWTPGAAMGLTLVRRLQERAGLSFQIVDEPLKP